MSRKTKSSVRKPRTRGLIDPLIDVIGVTESQPFLPRMVVEHWNPTALCRLEHDMCQMHTDYEGLYVKKGTIGFITQVFSKDDNSLAFGSGKTWFYWLDGCAVRSIPANYCNKDFAILREMPAWVKLWKELNPRRKADQPTGA